MKAKYIRLTLKKKVEEWLASIEDEAVRKLLSENVIITGGSIVSLLTDKPVNDFDVYFRTKEAAKAAAEYYVQKFRDNPPPRFKSIHEKEVEISVTDYADRIKIVVKSAGIAGEGGDGGSYQYFETLPEDADEAAEYVEAIGEGIEAASKDKDKKPYRPMFLSSNALTLTDRIQIIVRFYGEPEEIHKNYDFVHCTNYWTSWDNHLELRKEALEAILACELRYIGSKYPICSIFRLRKFLRRGWYITAGNLLKIMMQVNELDLDDWVVLEDQLTGVDMAYFAEVIALLKGKVDEHGKIDKAYLFEVLDKVF